MNEFKLGYIYAPSLRGDIQSGQSKGGAQKTGVAGNSDNKRRSEPLDESKKQVYYRLTICFAFSAKMSWNQSG